MQTHETLWILEQKEYLREQIDLYDFKIEENKKYDGGEIIVKFNNYIKYVEECYFKIFTEDFWVQTIVCLNDTHLLLDLRHAFFTQIIAGTNHIMETIGQKAVSGGQMEIKTVENKDYFDPKTFESLYVAEEVMDGTLRTLKTLQDPDIRVLVATVRCFIENLHDVINQIEALEKVFKTKKNSMSIEAWHKMVSYNLKIFRLVSTSNMLHLMADFGVDDSDINKALYLSPSPYLSRDNWLTAFEQADQSSPNYTNFCLFLTTYPNKYFDIVADWKIYQNLQRSVPMEDSIMNFVYQAYLLQSHLTESLSEEIPMLQHYRPSLKTVVNKVFKLNKKLVGFEKKIDFTIIEKGEQNNWLPNLPSPATNRAFLLSLTIVCGLLLVICCLLGFQVYVYYRRFRKEKKKSKTLFELVKRRKSSDG